VDRPEAPVTKGRSSPNALVAERVKGQGTLIANAKRDHIWLTDAPNWDGTSLDLLDGARTNGPGSWHNPVSLQRANTVLTSITPKGSEVRVLYGPPV